MQAEITLRQAAQQALEAMDKATRFMSDSDYKKLNQAIDDLRAALAEPEQEPDGISWLKRDSGYFTAPTPRKPLTPEQLMKIELGLRVYADNDRYDLSLHDFARAIERAHGIGEQHE